MVFWKSTFRLKEKTAPGLSPAVPHTPKSKVSLLAPTRIPGNSARRFIVRASGQASAARDSVALNAPRCIDWGF